MRALRPYLAAILGITLLLMPVPCFAGAGADRLVNLIQTHIIGNVLSIFGTVAAAAAFFYGFRTIIESNSESALTNTINTFVYALVGFAVIALAKPFTDAFTVSTPTGALLGPFQSLVSFIVTAAAGVFTLMMTVNGLKLIASQGESGEADKVKKVILINIGGVVLMGIAQSIVSTVAGNNPPAIVHEMAGLAYYILMIIGFVSVLAMIASGVMLVVSVDDSLKDRAKKTVIGTAISLVVVLASYTLITALI